MNGVGGGSAGIGSFPEKGPRRPRDNCGLKIGRFFGRIIHREGRGVELVRGEILPAET